MAGLARQRRSDGRGMQGRATPGAILYARDLQPAGLIGEVLTANLKNTVVQAQLQRGPGSIWQGCGQNGANHLRSPGARNRCPLSGARRVAELSARVSTRSGVAAREGKTYSRSPNASTCRRMVSGVRRDFKWPRPFESAGNDWRFDGRGKVRWSFAQMRVSLGPIRARGPGQGADGVDGRCRAKYRVLRRSTPLAPYNCGLGG